MKLVALDFHPQIKFQTVNPFFFYFKILTLTTPNFHALILHKNLVGQTSQIFAASLRKSMRGKNSTKQTVNNIFSGKEIKNKIFFNKEV
jgi:hypothetical protein